MNVIDTKAVGDSFVIGLAAMIVKVNNLKYSMEFAVVAGTLAVIKFGTQPSIPFKKEVDIEISKSNKFQSIKKYV